MPYKRTVFHVAGQAASLHSTKELFFIISVCRCSKCHWPVCGPQCEEKPIHRAECKVGTFCLLLPKKTFVLLSSGGKQTFSERCSLLLDSNLNHCQRAIRNGRRPIQSMNVSPPSESCYRGLRGRRTGRWWRGWPLTGRRG